MTKNKEKRSRPKDVQGVPTDAELHTNIHAYQLHKLAERATAWAAIARSLFQGIRTRRRGKRSGRYELISASVSARSLQSAY